MTNPIEVPGNGPPTTLQRTLQPGPALSTGRDGEYRRLVYGPGEPRVVRDDLAGESVALSRELVSLLNVGHLTDMQIADVQSPARFEFFEQLRPPGCGELRPRVAASGGAGHPRRRRDGPNVQPPRVQP